MSNHKNTTSKTLFTTLYKINVLQFLLTLENEI